MCLLSSYLRIPRVVNIVTNRLNNNPRNIPVEGTECLFCLSWTFSESCYYDMLVELRPSLNVFALILRKGRNEMIQWWFEQITLPSGEKIQSQ